jgi:dienelactone hydrolase
VRIVKQHPEIKSEAVGVFGVSQGGTLGPLAASRSADIDFVINVTGSATPLANQEMWGTGNELAKRGFSSEQISLAMKGLHLLYSARPLIQRGILPLDYLWFIPKDPYLDPADYWPQVKQPLLVAYGALDSVVPTTTSVEIASPILRNGHPSNRLYVYADAGHGIRRESGNWSDGHIEAMTAWSLAVTSGKEPASQPEISSAGIDSEVNRWYGMGNKETPWYGSAPIQLLLILFFTIELLLILFFTIVFLFAFVVSLMPFSGLQNNKYGHIPRIVLGLSGLLNLSILVSFLIALNFLLNADAEGYFPPVPMIGWLTFAPIVSIALTIVMLFTVQKGRRDAGWSSRVKGFYNLITLTSVGFMLFMGYWGLIFN